MTAGCRIIGLLTTALFFLISCAGVPRTAATVGPPAPPADQAQEAGTSTPFVATDELKKKTFDEVQDVIEALDHIIAQGDYDTWLKFLTADYIESRSSKAFLREASDAPILRKSGTTLGSLKDYFEKVVVQSRQQATLNEITFVDATHVKAYTRIQGSLYILYYLVREDGIWKIGVLPSGES